MNRLSGEDADALTTGDRNLVDRDRAIPLLDHVLDPTRALSLLAPSCAALAHVGRCEVSYLRYKPGVSLVAGVSLGHDRTPAMLMAVSEPARTKIEKLVRADGHAGHDPNTSVVAADPTHHLALATADHDRDLPGVAAAMTGRGLAGEHLAHDGVRPLRYLPGRRWLAVTVGRQPRWLVRVVRVAAVEHLAVTGTYLAQRLAAVPAVLGSDRRRGILLSEWVDGVPMNELPVSPSQLLALGRELAMLHALPPGPVVSGPDHAAEVAATAHAVAQVLPAVQDQARDVAQSVVSALPTHGPRVVCHGDLSSDQVIVGDGDNLSLIDFDRACMDHPASDLGSWSAQEILDGRCTEDGWRDALEPLVAGYSASSGTLSTAALRGFTAAAVFRRSVEPFRRRHPHWEAETRHRLMLAARLLDEVEA